MKGNGQQLVLSARRLNLATHPLGVLGKVLDLAPNDRQFLVVLLSDRDKSVEFLLKPHQGLLKRHDPGVLSEPGVLVLTFGLQGDQLLLDLQHMELVGVQEVALMLVQNGDQALVIVSEQVVHILVSLDALVDVVLHVGDIPLVRRHLRIHHDAQVLNEILEI